MEKTCSRCNDSKLTDFFSKMKASKDGFLAMCKDCDKKRRKRFKTRRSPKQIDVTPPQAAYLSGLLDGEGFIGIARCTRKKGKYLGQSFFNSRVVIGITSPVIHEIAAEYKIGRIHSCKNRNKKHKDRIDWCLNSNEIRGILPSLLPYLRIKKQQAILLLEFLRLAHTERDRTGVYRAKVTDIYWQLKVLNRRGAKPSETKETL